MEIQLLESMVPWIHLHRTHLKHLDVDATLEAYGKEIQSEFDLIKPFLPPAESVKSFLDIGCGLAGIDVLLKQHYRNADLYLLDSDGTSLNWGSGWNSNFKPFNSLKTMHEFLTLNGVVPAMVIPVDYQRPLEFDLVISFLSWGFHYSLFKYRVKTPCAIATIRRGPQADNLFVTSEYAGIRLGKTHTMIAQTEKYNLLKFTFDNVTTAR